MTHLFSPLQIKSIHLKNRIVVSPMCEYSSEDGFASDWHLVHLGSRAIGGAALVFTEATAVSPEGRITFADLGIWKDAHVEKLNQITAFITQNGAVPGMQLAHAGRKASHLQPWHGGTQVPSNKEHGWPTLAPSALAFTEGEEAPAALDLHGIQKIIEDFKTAAARALTAGFKVIEIHAAHGYLLTEFLSPLSNQRTDAYGGSFENRTRLLIEIVQAVHEVWPADHPLFVRISATEWTEGGWAVEDSVQLARLLKDRGVDLVDCSSGGNVTGVKIPLTPGYQVMLAEKVKRDSGILTGAVGLITDAQQASQIITDERADLIFLARQLLRDPYFPLRAAHELGHTVKWPDQYERGQWKK